MWAVAFGIQQMKVETYLTHKLQGIFLHKEKLLKYRNAGAYRKVNAAWLAFVIYVFFFWIKKKCQHDLRVKIFCRYIARNIFTFKKTHGHTGTNAPLVYNSIQFNTEKQWNYLSLQKIVFST